MKQYSADIILSGGGTGGHVFPAIAIAQELLIQRHDLKLLFVGAKGKMEMDKVPAAGFEIIGLPVSAFHRRLSWKNMLFPFRLIASMLMARKVIRQYKPALVIGTGGFASGPLLKAAHQCGVATMIQEQNAYPGVTNRLLGKQAARICVAHEGMDKWFNSDKLLITGNPVRKDLIITDGKRAEALRAFDLSGERPVLLLFGGSLGALALNETIQQSLLSIKEMDIDMIWQTGQTYYDKANSAVSSLLLNNIKVYAFLDRMDLAYAAANIIVCRAGAITLSELSLVKKPAILVPYPAAAGDHQLKNARSFEQQGAALVLENKNVNRELIERIKELVNNKKRQNELSLAIGNLRRPNAGKQIAEAALEILDKETNES